MNPVHVVGLGMSPADLTPRAWKIIDEAQVLVGGGRLLAYFPDHPAEKITLGKDPEATLKKLKPLMAHRRIVVLASGDPNFFGIGTLAVRVLGMDHVVVHPNVTALQAACARLKLAWQDARMVSLHGRSWEPLHKALKEADKLVIYTDPAHTPAEIAGLLLAAGLRPALFCVLEDLGQETERLSRLSPEEAQQREFSPLNVVVVLRKPQTEEGPRPQESSPEAATRLPLHLGLPEEALVHQAGLITKTEVRAVVLAKLALLPGQVFWDIGAGCGSVSLEASLLLGEGQVFAIEQDPERAAQIEINRSRFGAANLEIVLGQAPVCLGGLPDPQRVFVGGGGKNVPEILGAVLPRLGRGGRVVLTAALLETLETARAMLDQAGWHHDLVHLQVSRGQALGAGTHLKALNPVWIIAGWQE